MFKKAMIYLGLGPDEEYEQYDDFAPAGAPAADEARPVVRAVADTPSRPVSSTVRAIPSSPSVNTVRAVPAEKPEAEEEPVLASSPAPARTEAPGRSSGSLGDGASAIRIVDSAPSKPHAVSPSSFNEAQGIGDRFKSGQPVIVNLQGVERDLRRRLVDFASGLCYALGGKMDRVADQVYLLTPADVEVSDDDTRRALD